MAKRSLILLSSTALAASLWAGSMAHAQSIDAAGADALEAQFTAGINQLIGPSPELTWSFEGMLEAVPAGDAYQLAVPPITVRVDREVEISIPATDAVVTPLPDGLSRAQWSFVSPFIFSNPRDSGDRAELSFTSDANSLDIAPAYGLSLAGSVGISDAALNVVGMEGTITLDRFAVAIDSSPIEGAADTYDSRTDAGISGLSVDVEGIVVSLGSVDLAGESSRQRLDLFKILNDALAGMDPDSDAFAQAVLDVLRTHQNEDWLGGAVVNISLSDMLFDTPDGSGAISAATMAMSVENLDQPQANLGVFIEVDEVSLDQLPAQFEPVSPTFLSLDIEAVDTPTKALLNEVYAAMGEGGGEEMGPKGRRAGSGGGFEGLRALTPDVFLGILLNSDAQLLLNDFHVEAPIGYLSANGTVDPDPAAALQMTASISLDIAGLPEMIAFAQQMGGDAAQGAALATAIAAMGRDGTDSDGVAIKEFDLEVTVAGQVLLNGNDMSAMMGMFQ
jgi:hypothetical protein